MKRDLLTNEPFEPARSTMSFINASNRIKFANLKQKKNVKQSLIFKNH